MPTPSAAPMAAPMATLPSNKPVPAPSAVSQSTLAGNAMPPQRGHAEGLVSFRVLVFKRTAPSSGISESPQSVRLVTSTR